VAKDNAEVVGQARRHEDCGARAYMKPRVPALVFTAALALLSLLAQGSAAAPGADQATPTPQVACTDLSMCPEVTPTPDIQVAGVQTSADDARQPGEADPYIINSGFGD
jgi:hypothetical protein